MNYLELLVDFHINNKRQGPGGTDETLRALSFLNFDNARTIKIADIGCGNGAQTFVLASHTNSEITAIDLFPQFLEKLDRKAKELKLSDKIKTKCESMEKLSFAEGSLDLIWSEGAIYNMGYEKGLKYWHKFLKNKGYIAVSEICWLRSNPPKELVDFWKDAYSEMDFISSKIKIMEEAGYAPIGFFSLPERCWIENYYEPANLGIPDFLNRHAHSDVAKRVVKEHWDEIGLYKKYIDYYGYGFFIGQKV
jgi:SAM-dependent methyltransferase